MEWHGVHAIGRVGSGGRAAVTLALGLLVGAVDAQSTWHVPSQVPSITRALQAATEGDTILVAPGRYVGSLDFQGKGVEVVGMAGSDLTTIVGDGGPAVLAVLDQPGTARLAGFTITGGTGTPPGFGPGLEGVGGGLFIGSPGGPSSGEFVLEDCVVTGNRAPVAGGGFYLNWAKGAVRNVVVSHNLSGGIGGGIQTGAFSLTTLEHVRLTHNRAAGHGGGLGLNNTGGQWSDLTVEHNQAGGDGGGVWYVAQSFGLPIDGLLLRGNRAGGNGGGLAIHRTTASFPGLTPSTDIVLWGNRAEAAGGGLYIDAEAQGLGLFLQQFGEQLRGLVFAHNVAGTTGGGAHIEVVNHGSGGFMPQASIEFEQCTFVGNLAGDSGGAAWVRTELGGSNQFQTATSSIVQDNLPDDWGGEGVAVSHSQVDQLTPGPGNDAADPLFLDPDAGDYGLRGGSPCIDSGADGLALDADGSPPDRGALPFLPWIEDGPGLAGGFGLPELTGTGLNSPGAPTTLEVTGAAPHSPVVLAMGFDVARLPLAGGTLVPEVLWVLTTDTAADGRAQWSGAWTDLPSDTRTWLQAWIMDPSGPEGWTASPALRATAR